MQKLIVCHVVPLVVCLFVRHIKQSISYICENFLLVIILKKWISSSGNYTKKLCSCTQRKYLVQVVHISLRITIEVLAPWSQGNKQFISKTMRMDTLDLSRWKTYCILQTLRFGHNKLCPQKLRIPVSRNHKYMFYIVVFRHMVF